MIPLGSCTMKLNAATEMEPITWPAFADLHPFAPLDQAAGTSRWCASSSTGSPTITGYDAVSLQPNAGSQGELAGLLAIRAYHRANGRRRSATSASSRRRAHGTNAASARSWPACASSSSRATDGGNVDLDDLALKIEEHARPTSPR